MRKKQIILDRTAIKNKINRIAFSIIEEYYNEKQITIIGFEKNGYIIAKKLQMGQRKYACFYWKK